MYNLIWLPLLGLLFQVGLFAQGGTRQAQTLPIVVTDTLFGAVGAEDITFEPTTGIAFISSDDRRAARNDRPTDGAIYACNAGAESPVLRLLTFQLPFTFHPHGLSYYHDPRTDERRLFVINHRASHRDSSFVEIFRWDGTQLHYLESVQNRLLFAPNDVCAVGLKQFYATNDHGARHNFGWFWEVFLRQKRSYLVYWDGQHMTKALRKIAYANGVNTSADGQHVYVASVLKGRLHICQRDTTTGGLTQLAAPRIRQGLDNIERDSSGKLWVVAHSRPSRFLAHVMDSSRASPWEVWRVDATNPQLPIAEQLLQYHGRGFSGASVAALWRQTLLIGTVFEPRIWRAYVP
jgi:arylesterase/paraoxonase